MVQKVKGKYYLNRAEVVDYLTHAYKLKWCLTRWIGHCVSVSFEPVQGSRNVIKVPAYFLDNQNKAFISQVELDLEMMKIIG